MSFLICAIFLPSAHRCNEFEAMVNKERRRSGLSVDLACDGRLRFIAAQHTYDAERLEAVRGGRAYRALGNQRALYLL